MFPRIIPTAAIVFIIALSFGEQDAAAVDGGLLDSVTSGFSGIVSQLSKTISDGTLDAFQNAGNQTKTAVEQLTQKLRDLQGNASTFAKGQMTEAETLLKQLRDLAPRVPAAADEGLRTQIANVLQRVDAIVANITTTQQEAKVEP